MKILLDECLPIDFRHSFSEHESHTVQWTGLKGKKNGELLETAEAAGYSVLITVDQGIAYQQKISTRKLAIVLVSSRTNQLEDLLPMASAICEALQTVTPGQVVRVSS